LSRGFVERLAPLRAPQCYVNSAAQGDRPIGRTRARFKDEADAEALIDNIGGWKVAARSGAAG
jgi:hypothetical protein